MRKRLSRDPNLMGEYDKASRTIWLSCPVERARRTLLHEMIHASGIHDHGRRFQSEHGSPTWARNGPNKNEQPTPTRQRCAGNCGGGCEKSVSGESLLRHLTGGRPGHGRDDRRST